MRIFNFLMLFAFVALVGCSNESPKTEPTINDKLSESSLVVANKYLVRSEEENIIDFVKRYDWKMKQSGTGLRYVIEYKGNGPLVEYGNTVTIAYTIRLLTGDIVASSDKNGLKQFVSGKGGVEAGLEEGIKLMRKGDQAKFILPSHLAFGLMGDGEKIPPRASLVYEVELIKIQQ